MATEDLAERRLLLQSAAKVKVKRQKWLWQYRIPMGALTLLGGREGSGKSTVTIDIAAQVTRGDLPGEFEGIPRHVLMVVTEDSLGSVILPRLIAAKADLGMVDFLRVRDGAVSDVLDLDLDLEQLEEVLKRKTTALTIFDPIKSSIGEQIKEKEAKQLRRVLEPLNHVCDRANTSMLGIMHFNKREGGDIGTRMSGLSEWSQVARATIGVVKDPEHEHEFLLENGKNNNAPDQPTLRGKTVGVMVPVPGDEDTETSKIEWLGESDSTFDDVANPTRNAGAKTNVDEWLSQVLESNGGSMLVEDIEQMALEQGVCKARALRNAKIRLGLESHKGFQTKARWSFKLRMDD